MSDPKTEQVNEPQTLRDLVAELTPDELDSSEFVVCIGVGSRTATIWSGGAANLKRLAAHAGVVINAAFKDENEAMALRKEGRLN